MLGYTTRLGNRIRTRARNRTRLLGVLDYDDDYEYDYVYVYEHEYDWVGLALHQFPCPLAERRPIYLHPPALVIRHGKKGVRNLVAFDEREFAAKVSAL